jgi:hypothetical protein
VVGLSPQERSCPAMPAPASISWWSTEPYP